MEVKQMSKTNIEKTMDLIDPRLLTNEELAELIPHVERIADWCKKVEAAAIDKLLSSEKIPGYKIVEGTSRERISDPDGLVKKLEEAGYSKASLFDTNLKSLTDLRKVVGAKEFKALAVGFTEKPKGSPKLVKETEKGVPYVNTDFDDIIGGK